MSLWLVFKLFVWQCKEHFQCFHKWLLMCYYCFPFFSHSSNLLPDYFHSWKNYSLNEIPKSMGSEAWVETRVLVFLKAFTDSNVEPVVRTITFAIASSVKILPSLSGFWIFTQNSDSWWEDLFALAWAMSPHEVRVPLTASRLGETVSQRKGCRTDRSPGGHCSIQ